MTEPTMIIDPPVSEYSSPEEINAWLDELHAMPDRPEVRDAIEEAEEWLAYSQLVK